MEVLKSTLFVYKINKRLSQSISSIGEVANNDSSSDSCSKEFNVT